MAAGRALAPVSQVAMLSTLSLGLPLLGASELQESPDVMWARMCRVRKSF